MSPNNQKTKKSILSYILLTAGIALVYFVSAKLGLQLASVNPSATAVWPPTGIAIACLLIFGYRASLGIFIGAFFGNLTTAGTIITSLGIATGNMLEGIVSAYLVNKFAHGKKALNQSLDVFGFILFAGIIGTMVSASIGVTTLLLGGLLHLVNLQATWITWWLGDMAGALTVAPLLIAISNIRRHNWNFEKIFEMASFLILLTAATVITFGLSPFGGLKNYPLIFIPIPFLLWAAFRFEQEGVTLGIIIVSAIAVWATTYGIGPFAHIPLNDSLLLLGTFMSITAAAMLSTAGVVSERRQTIDALAVQERRFRKLIEKNTDVIFLVDSHAIIRYVSPSIELILGYKPEELLGVNRFSLIHPDDLQNAKQAFNALTQNLGNTFKIKTRSRKKDGVWLWVESIGTNLLDDPDVHAIVINYRDINQENENQKIKS